MGQGQGDQEQQLRSGLSIEKAQMRRQHERELQALQDKMADEQVWHPTADSATTHDLLPYHIFVVESICRMTQND